MGKARRFLRLRGCTGEKCCGKGSGFEARGVIGQFGVLLSVSSSLIGCGPLGGFSPELHQERPHFGVSIDPDRNGSEVTIRATVSNTSDRDPLDIRQARITFLSASTIEIPPHQINGPCVQSIVLPRQSCTFTMSYEVGARQGTAFWEFVLDGQVVQFTLKN